MLGLLNKLYLLLILYGGFIVYEAYTEVELEKEVLLADQNSVAANIAKKKKEQFLTTYYQMSSNLTHK